MVAACSDDSGPGTSDDTGIDAADVTDVGDVAPDGSGDVGLDADADVEDEETSDELLPCGEGDTCAEGTICVEGFCESLACAIPNDWPKCAALFNRIEPDRGRYATCTDGMCRESCFFDDDCPEGTICTDFGECQVFTGDLGVEHPYGPATGDLVAGVANTLMNYPIGVPLGGFGTRAAANDGRYAVSLKASAGQFEGLYARAIVLDNGERHLMIIRLPVIFTDMALHEEVARALQEETGEEWRDSLMISSTHTHSGPCRHWHLPEQAAAPLGSFGIGEFSQFFHDRMKEVAVGLALEALENRAPAKIGWEIIESFDNDDQVGRDRWTQTPPFDDNRVLLMRVDDLDDVPIAALFSYGAHGTDNGTDYLTGDGIGHTETAFEAALGREFGRFIPAFYLNQNSGTMGPAGGAAGHDFPMSMERMGWAFVDKTFDDFLAIETQREMTLTTNNMRFYLSYDLMGYERDQFGSTFNRPFGGEYHYGGLSCVGQFGGDEDYATHQTLEDLTCAGALQFLLYNSPPTTLTRSQIMTIELNGLTSVVVPGELSMELSWEMLRRLRDDFGVDPLEAWTFGYANDHLFYLLPTNLRGELPPFPGISTPMAPDEYPDFAFSFLQGGYESTMSMWGPAHGDFLIDRVAETYHQMIDTEFDLGREEPVPSQYDGREEEPFERQSTEASVAGAITVQPPSEVARFDTIEIAWFGGDPEAEMPQVPVVTLERFEDDAWSPVITDSLVPYTNLTPKMITRVRQEADGEDFEWVVRWEELGNFPSGTYRFQIAGHYFDAAFERLPYTVATDEFEVVPTDAIVVEVTADETGFSGTAGFPSDVRGRFEGPSSDPGLAEGNFRMRHPMVPTGWNSPIEEPFEEVTIRVLDGAVTAAVFEGADVSYVFEPRVVEGRTIPVSAFSVASEVVDAEELDPGEYTIEVSVEDSYGNTGFLSTTLSL
jgi:hypothetical protein